MSKLEKLNFEESKIEKSRLSNIYGGTSTTMMVEVGCTGENEYPEGEDGKPDYSVKPILVLRPCENPDDTCN